MTMAHERTRSVVQTRDFLQELARDTSLPENVRYQANNLLALPDSRSRLVGWSSGRAIQARAFPIGRQAWTSTSGVSQLAVK